MLVAPGEVNDLSLAYRDAALEAGHSFTEDLNGKDQEGIGPPERNIVDGVRQSAADMGICVRCWVGPI